MVDQKRPLSLVEAYIQGVADLVVWLLPAVVTGLVIATAQRVFLEPPKSENRGNQ